MAEPHLPESESTSDYDKEPELSNFVINRFLFNIFKSFYFLIKNTFLMFFILLVNVFYIYGAP